MQNSNKPLPIGIQDFEKLITEGFFYLDKTKQIIDLTKGSSYFFLSRPRRFGKSLTLSVMKFLYLGRKDLFKGLWAENNWNFDNTYPVIYMSFAGYTKDQDMREYIKKNLQIFIEDNIFELKDFSNEFNLREILKAVYKKTQKQSVILVDEYDKGVLAHLSNVDKAEEIRDFFTSFYSGVKDSDSMIKLFLLTGLTKILKMSVFSVLNNLVDISYSPLSYNLMGYTQKELEDNFEFKDKEEIDKLKENYNGYNFGNEQDTIYNPWNINNYLLTRLFRFYWADTGIPSSILEYIKKNSIDIKSFVEELNTGILIAKESDFVFQYLDKLNVKALFTNAGYLTIKKFESNGYILKYPNKETEYVMNNFFFELSNNKLDSSKIEVIGNGIFNGIITQDKDILEEAFNMMIYDFLGDTPYEWLNKNPEGWFKTFLGMFLRINSICYYPEVENIKGRKDFVIPYNDKYYIIEAKVNKSTKEAIEQINKKYIPQFTDNKEIIKIGLNWIRKEEDQRVEVEFEIFDKLL